MYKGLNIKKIREKKHISGKQLAQLSGYAPSYISELEHDKATPTVSTISDIAQALEVPTCVVMDESFYYPHLSDLDVKVSDSKVIMSSNLFNELQSSWVEILKNWEIEDVEELLIYIKTKNEIRIKRHK